MDCLKEVVQDRANFNSLELAGTYKEIVTGLVDTHFRGRDKEKQSAGAERPGFDVVRAKGESWCCRIM